MIALGIREGPPQYRRRAFTQMKNRGYIIMKRRKLLAALLAALLLAGTVGALADVKIGVPNDTTNEARALRLLEYNGILELNAEAGQTATKADVLTEGIEIVEVEAAMLPNLLPDLDYAVMNLNFVLDAVNAGIEIDDPLLLEDEANYLPNANVIAVKIRYNIIA